MEEIKDILKRLRSKIVANPNLSLFAELCTVFDKTGLTSVTYCKAVDAYDIQYEDGRGDPEYIRINRKDISCLNLK